jgi:hypothetical protein
LESEGYVGNNPPQTNGYEDCLRTCGPCGIGLSNGQQPVRIFHNRLNNIPEEVRENCNQTLENAINIRNRPNKLKKFASENSEDAVTWSVFSHLLTTGQLAGVLHHCGVQIADANDMKPRLLLWGAPVPLADPETLDLSGNLIQCIDQIENQPNSRTEPDVVIDFGEHGIVFIEVKYRSSNDNKPADYAGWPVYLQNTEAFLDPQAVSTSGQYELVRNWRIGWDVRRGRPMSLINLGSQPLFVGKEDERLLGFQEALNQNNECSFQRLTWPEFIHALPNIPDWLEEYVNDKGLNAV